MKKHNLALLLGLLASSGVFAANVTISGVIPGTVLLNRSGISAYTGKPGLTAAPVEQVIQYERIVLSPEAKKYLADHVDATQNNGMLMAMNSANSNVSSTQLGMNKVEVLNQGSHGTCATFATTAALDAALGRNGELGISQLCNLELGSYLQSKNQDYPSGWEGSDNTIILKQITKYGAINLKSQQDYGCSGVKTYPLNDENSTGKPMSVDKFLGRSELVMKNISYKSILDTENAFSASPQNSDTTKLSNIKNALINGHRVVFGMLLDEEIGHNGTAGKSKVNFDSWVKTPEIAKKAKTKKGLTAGHAMVITGFDDNAVIIDANKVKHTGVFTLRNSWGPDAGDSGNYYMSYDYLTFVMEAMEIIPSAS